MTAIRSFARYAVCVAVALTVGTATAADPPFRAFAQEAAQRHGLDAERVMDILQSSERRQDIIDAISSPAEGLPWYRYRPIFMKDNRIRGGVRFWARHEALLKEAEERYGVPPALIVAVLGVETRYGNYTGRHRVIDALRTLAFDYPPRAGFFRSELTEFLLLSEEESIDPLEPKGSYAGAMGMPQFIASSYRAYAVDFNGNGRRDLWDETADAVGSVANYFAEHGWQRSEPVVARATVAGDDWQRLRASGLKPNTTVGALRDAGVRTDSDYPRHAPARLVELETRDGKEYWVARRNFYVITRYNHSALYAMAVHQLSEAIRERREQAQ